MKTAYAILQNAYDLIQHPDNWTTGVLSRNIEGREVPLHSREACKFCMYGAIMTAIGQNTHGAYIGRPAVDQLDAVHHTRVAVQLVCRQLGERSIGTFNDEATHTEVLIAMGKAMYEAREQNL